MKLLPILSAEKLFSYCKIDPTFSELRLHAGLDAPVFDSIVSPTLNAFAELVQLAPASEAHHHSGAGGLLKHTYDVIQLALKKRRGYQLPISGSLLELSEQRHIWTYAVFIGCLLHDIGKLSASTRLIPVTKTGIEKQWTPHSGSMTRMNDLKGYRIEFRKTPYHYHARLALTHWGLIPQNGRTWLIQASNIMAELTAWLWGDRFESGTIGEIVEAADRESTAKNLLLPADNRFSDAISAIDRYLKMIRGWMQDGAIKTNINGGMGWIDKNGHIYFVCRSLAEKIIQECSTQGLKNLPHDPVRVYDILQEHGYALSTEDGKAIWPIRVKTATYEHKFTCLKFEARKLVPPSWTLKPLDGEITIIGEEIIPDTAPPANAVITGETAKTETEKSEGELKPAAIAAEPAAEIPQDTAVIAVEAGENLVLPIPEAAVLRDTVEITPEPVPEPVAGAIAHGEQTQETEETIKNIPESGAILESVSIIRNLNLEAPDTAEKFLSWLQRGLLEKTILINNNSAEVHIVEEGVFLLAPAIFKTFLRLHGHPEEKHKNLSKRFARLRKHLRHGDFNIHPYWVSSANRASKINGWVIPFNIIYGDDSQIPNPNKYIKKYLGVLNE